ncbi:MAG: metallophosphoesterase [Candidatus Brockarchaeota archaeon]|nr:metallophosphoesterase [Candidatus Brockarchaeota archaeon]
MQLTEDVEIVEFEPALYVKSLDAMVVADIHLGLEWELEEKGVHIPFPTYEPIVKSLRNMFSYRPARRMIILGDIKNEFGDINPEEWTQVQDFVNDVRSLGAEPILIRGNHDNFVRIVLKRLNVEFQDPPVRIGKYFLIHGDKDHGLPGEGTIVLMGHEHPVISIRDSIGVKHRFKSFLYGKYYGTEIIVLPSMNPLTMGTAVNEVDVGELLSPVLRKVDIMSFTPILLAQGEVLKKFPKISNLLA